MGATTVEGIKSWQLSPGGMRILNEAITGRQYALAISEDEHDVYVDPNLEVEEADRQFLEQLNALGFTKETLGAALSAEQEIANVLYGENGSPGLIDLERQLRQGGTVDEEQKNFLVEVEPKLTAAMWM